MKPSLGINKTIHKLKTKWNLRRILKVVVTGYLILVIATLLLATLGTVVHATGLVDDTVNIANEYSKYPLGNYQLDFYVDNRDRKSTRLNSSHVSISYAVFCLKK